MASLANKPVRSPVPGARQAAWYPASHRLTVARSVTCFMVLDIGASAKFRPPLPAPAHPAADGRVSGLIGRVGKCVAEAGGVCFSDGHGRIR